MLRKPLSAFGKTAVPAALFVAAVVAVAMFAQSTPAPASNAPSNLGRNIELTTHNNGSTTVAATFCPWHATAASDPSGCPSTPTGGHLSAHGGKIGPYTANPIGAVIRATAHRAVYVYARNPSIGPVWFQVNGHRVNMVEGQVTRVATAGGGIIELQRPGDRNRHKIMVINIIKMGVA
jgi:hypothetical protein